MIRTDLYTLQRNYNQACTPIDWNQYHHYSCSGEDGVAAYRQEAMEYHGEKLANYEGWLKDTLDGYHEAVFEVEFWKQMLEAVYDRTVQSEIFYTPVIFADYYQAGINLREALKNLSHYEALIKRDLGNALASMMDDINWETSHRCRSPRFHVLEESDGFYSVFNDNDVPF